MQIKLNEVRELVSVETIPIGEMFVHHVERPYGEIILCLKIDDRNSCYEVGGVRAFEFHKTLAVYPVRTLTVNY